MSYQKLNRNLEESYDQSCDPRQVGKLKHFEISEHLFMYISPIKIPFGLFFSVLQTYSLYMKVARWFMKHHWWCMIYKETEALWPLVRVPLPCKSGDIVTRDPPLVTAFGAGGQRGYKAQSWRAGGEEEETATTPQPDCYCLVVAAELLEKLFSRFQLLLSFAFSLSYSSGPNTNSIHFIILPYLRSGALKTMKIWVS